jgi:hypothetical protein
MSRKRGPNRVRQVNCVVCALPFPTSHSQGRYCSEACRREGHNAAFRRYGERNRAARREYGRRHYAENVDAVVAKTRAYQKTEAGKQAIRRTAERQKALHPDRFAARQIVSDAKKRGDLKANPCVRCGGTPSEAHHPDYSKPLDVVWLCHGHHREEHGRIARKAA